MPNVTASAAVKPGRSARDFRQPLIWIALAVALMGYRFFHFISLYSVNILFYDQWDFLSDFFPGGHITLARLFFRQHGPHREGVGLIADWLLYRLTSWNIRAESFMIGGCIFAAMLLAVELKRRLAGRLAWTDALLPVIFLTLVQWETMIGTPNPGYAGFPLLFIVLYCLALLPADYRWRYPILLILNFLTIFSGFGFFMGIVTIGLFALELYWSRRRVTAVPPLASAAGLLMACASLGSFFIHYHFAPAADCFAFPHAPYSPYAVFTAVMFSNFSGLWIFGSYAPGTPLALLRVFGTIPALCLIAVFLTAGSRLLRPQPDRRTSLVTAVLIGFSGLYAINTAIGRACLGPSYAFNSRYATLLIPAFLGLYVFGAETLLESGRVRPAIRALALVLIALLVVPGGVVTPEVFRYYANGKRAWEACYLQKESIAACDQITHFQIYPHPELNGLRGKLDYLKAHHLSLFAGQPEKPRN